MTRLSTWRLYQLGHEDVGWVGGAAGRVRTGDLHLGKVTRYLLRYNRVGRAFGGNRTLCLRRTIAALDMVSFEGGWVPREGVEPPLTGV